MRPANRQRFLMQALAFAAGLLVLRVTVRILANYRGYFPPDFNVDFLRGREGHFWGAYSWAFYAHIASGPFTLVAGLILMSTAFRRRWPAWHRLLGRAQVFCVVGIVAPSGLWMARYAQAGTVAGVGLATLAFATATCAILGFRSAVRRDFVDHRLWMTRCYLLLCSAVVLRLIGGLATVAGVSAPWFNPLANWVAWIAPVAAFELGRRSRSFAILTGS